MTHVLFGPEVREMLEENNAAAMRVFCESLHPATVAETLTGELGVEQICRSIAASAVFIMSPQNTRLLMRWIRSPDSRSLFRG